MNLLDIIQTYEDGGLDAWSSSELHEAAKKCRDRVEAIDNEVLDYGETDDLVDERNRMDEIEAHILYLLESR